MTGDARVRLRMQSGTVHVGRLPRRRTRLPGAFRRLARLADRLTGRDLTERYVIGLRAWDATLRGEPAHVALHHAERALAGGIRWAEADRGFEVPVLVALTFMYADRPGRTEELFAAGIADFESQGWHGAHLSFGYTLLGYVRYRRGRLAEAEDFARAGLGSRNASAPEPRPLVRRRRHHPDPARPRSRRRGRPDRRGPRVGAPFPAAVTFPDVQTVHGELLLARGLTKEAAAELEAAGRRLDPRGMRNPSWCPWQLHLARAEKHDAPERAVATALEAVHRARQFGAPSAVGQALRAAADVSSGSRTTSSSLEESVSHLERSPGRLRTGLRAGRPGHRTAPLGLSQGSRRTPLPGTGRGHAVRRRRSRRRGPRRAGRRRTAPAPPARRDGRRRRRSDLGAAALTARGRTTTEVAEELGTEEPTVVRLLSAVYRKVGTDRTGLAAALGQQTAR